jgi:hypothetical protein
MPCDLPRHTAEDRTIQTRHAPRSEEHQVGMRSFCGSYDFLCRAAFDRQGMDRQAAMRHDLPHPLQHLPPALLSHANQRLGRLTELRCRRGQQVEYAIVGRLDDVQDGYLDVAGTFSARSNRAAAKACSDSSTAKRTRRPLARSRGAPLPRPRLIRTEHGAELSTPSRD